MCGSLLQCYPAHGIQEGLEDLTPPSFSGESTENTLVNNDGSFQTIEASEFPVSNEQDYETTVPVSIVITVDNEDFTLSLGEGARIRTAAKRFITERNLDNSYMEPIENALIKEAKRVYDSMQSISATSASNNAASSSSSSSPSSIVATIDVNLNDDVYTCQVYANETPQEAARRFCALYNLANDEEYDSILRLLINRLRNTLGYTDNLPFTTDTTRTIAVVEVDTGDGTGRLLKLRVLEGETPIEAARGFLDRTGFDMGNLQALTQIVEQKMREQTVREDTSSTTIGSTSNTVDNAASEEEIISPSEGISLIVDVDDGRTLDPLVYRFGQDSTVVATEFLTKAGLNTHNRFSEFVALISNGIMERVQSVQDSVVSSSDNGSVLSDDSGSMDSSLPIQGGKNDESSSSSSTTVFMEQELPIDEQLINSPITATVPLMVGEVTYDVAVTKGDNLRALARAFCRSEWEVVAPGLELALKNSRENLENGDILPLTATEDMCIAVVYDIAATYLGALAEEYTAQILKDSFNPVLSTENIQSSTSSRFSSNPPPTTTNANPSSINLTGTVRLPQGAGIDGMTGSG